MTTTTHDEPNYMGVFWWLLALTLLEVGVIYMPIHRIAEFWSFSWSWRYPKRYW